MHMCSKTNTACRFEGKLKGAADERVIELHFAKQLVLGAFGHLQTQKGHMC